MEHTFITAYIRYHSFSVAVSPPSVLTDYCYPLFKCCYYYYTIILAMYSRTNTVTLVFGPMFSSTIMITQ